MIERVMKLFVIRSTSQRKLVQKFEKYIKAGQLDKVIQAKAPVGKKYPILDVVKAGAQAARNLGGRDEIRSKMDEVLLNEKEKLEKRTGFLAMLGNVGTLLGLLGTIVGLIKAFASVTDSNPVEKAALLTQGISMAMNTTAYGLIMAIPALVAYSILQNRANALNEDLTQAALRAYNWLSYHLDPIKRKTGSAVVGRHQKVKLD
ncbi:MAG: MotA/TolQ/ExbB proton channel family protein [Bdellovibrio sp.]|nr:MAG: MotA/TolQ/ExbB proton channel family protein [Bdellovibrio sp.]